MRARTTMNSAILALLLGCSLVACNEDCPDVSDKAVAEVKEMSFAGVWKTSYGDVYFPKYEGNMVRGAFWSYPESNGQADNGRIIAEVDGKTMTGFWVEDTGNTRCNSERDGSYHWGPLHFNGNEDFSVISGAWGVCDEQPAGDDAAWVGTRD